MNGFSIFTTVFLLLTTLSCSTTEQVKKDYAQSQPKNPNTSLSRLAVDQFFQRIKPAQKEIEELYGLAVKLQKVGRHHPAIETFKEVLRQDPDNLKALSGIAISLDLIGAHAAAATYYQQALKVNPRQDHIWNNLGYCYFLQDEMVLSIEAYQKAIAINPNLQRYHNNLARVLTKQNPASGPRGQIKLAQKTASPSKAPVKPAPDKGVKIWDAQLVIDESLTNIDRTPSKSVVEQESVVSNKKTVVKIEKPFIPDFA